MAETRRARILAATPRPVRPIVEASLPRLRALVDWIRASRRFGLRSFLPLYLNVVRETHSVREGTRRFRLTDGAHEDCDYTLRRNIHRLEKGLISRPRRAVFAVDYIEATVDHFAHCARHASSRSILAGELAWSRDVLEAYFESVASTPEINRARRRFHSLILPPRESGHLLTPYLRDLSEAPPVSIEALRELAVRRRSVRWFDGRPVPRETLDAAMQVAALAPSACNRQPFEFRVYDDPERARRIAEIPGGASGFTECLPSIVAVVGGLDAFSSERDRHLIYIDASLAVMSFMLALETLGLSSYAMNTPGVEVVEQRLARELELLPHERPIMLVAVGYPDPNGMVPRSEKKHLDQLRRFIP